MRQVLSFDSHSLLFFGYYIGSFIALFSCAVCVLYCFFLFVLFCNRLVVRLQYFLVLNLPLYIKMLLIMANWQHLFVRCNANNIYLVRNDFNAPNASNPNTAIRTTTNTEVNFGTIQLHNATEWILQSVISMLVCMHSFVHFLCLFPALVTSHRYSYRRILNMFILRRKIQRKILFTFIFSLNIIFYQGILLPKHFNFS